MLTSTMRLNRGLGLLAGALGILAVLSAWPQLLSAQPVASSATFLKFFATSPADNLHTVPNGRTFVLTDVVCRQSVFGGAAVVSAIVRRGTAAASEDDLVNVFVAPNANVALHFQTGFALTAGQVLKLRKGGTGANNVSCTLTGYQQ
jgi:hypothetical protein